VAFGRFTGMGGFPGKYVNSVCTNFARKLDGRLVSAARHHMHERKGKKKNCTNLANNLVEEAAREGLLDPLLEPPVWGPVGYVSLVGGTTAPCEQGNNAAGSVQDDGARISRGGEGAALLVVGQDGGLDGRAHDAVLAVDASERVQSIGPADGSARGLTVLHHHQYLLAVHVKVLWLANLVVLDDAKGL